MFGFRWAFWSSALSYKFKLFFFLLHFCLVYSCSVKLFIFLSNISSHLYQSYVYKFSLMMIEICVIWSSLQLSYHISLTISSAAVKLPQCYRNLPLTTMLRCPASLIEIQGSGTLGVGVLLLYVYLYTYSH